MKDLDSLRLIIDECDKQIVEAIEKRFHAVKDVVAYKKEHDLPIFQPHREEKVLEKVVSHLTTEEFSEELKSIYQFIMDKSKEIQNKTK